MTSFKINVPILNSGDQIERYSEVLLDTNYQNGSYKAASTTLTNGDKIFAWSTAPYFISQRVNYSIYGAIIKSDGETSELFEISPPYTGRYGDHLYYQPDLKSLQNGGYAVTWEDLQSSGQSNGVYLRTFNSANEANSDIVLVAKPPAMPWVSNAAPSIDVIDPNNFLVSWHTWDGANYVQLKTEVNIRLGDKSNNLIEGGDRENFIYGWDGDDTLNGGASSDSLIGGSGNDELMGGAGNDTLDGGTGFNCADYTSETTNLSINLKTGVATGRDALGIAAIGADKLISIQEACAGSGNDSLVGADTSSQLEGGAGSDTMVGGTASDTLIGGDGNDNLNGGDGADTLFGGAGSDSIVGGSGNDELIGGGGNDTLDGGSGFNCADYTSETTNLSINLKAGVATGRDASGIAAVGTDSLINIQEACAGSGNDSIVGADTSSQLEGGAGSDTLTGGLASDTLYGGDGNDVVNAGAGDDLIIGGDGAGDDNYDGGSGRDTVKYTSALDGITVNLAAGSATSSLGGDAAGIGTDILNSIENVIAGYHNDLIIGSADKNTILGEAGNDTIFGGDGRDILSGGEGNDYLDGGAGADLLMGGTGDDIYIIDSLKDVIIEQSGWDTIKTQNLNEINLQRYRGIEAAEYTGTGSATLTGNQSSNLLIGSTGADTLTGKFGNDTLSGAGGSDKFVFNAKLDAQLNFDQITDFSTGSDKLVLDKTIFMRFTSAVQDSNLVVGTEAQDNDDYLIYDSNTQTLYYDADGNAVGAKVAFAQLIGVNNLSSSDFSLI